MADDPTGAAALIAQAITRLGTIPAAWTGQFTGVLPYINGGTGTGSPFIAGSVIFAGASGFSQDNAHFRYDPINQILFLPTEDRILGNAFNLGGITFYDRTNATKWASITALSTGGGQLQFLTNAGTAMTIDASQHVGIGTTGPSALSVQQSLLDMTNSVAAFSLVGRQGATGSGTFHTRGFNVDGRVLIPTGVTDAGWKTGFYIDVLRNEGLTDDSGTSSGVIFGGRITAGHLNSGAYTPQSATIYGLDLATYGTTGTITTLTALNIGYSGGGTVTNNYGIFQGSALQKNCFAGNVGIGTAILAVRST